METVRISIKNRNALAILEGMEKAGLIILPKKEVKNRNLSLQLRGSISADKAQKMIDYVDKEREEWDRKF